MSYIPNLTALPLHEILLDNGYVINKNKHSKNGKLSKLKCKKKIEVF
ncbi:hypothetical protein NP05261_15150 [Helicobacter pylori]